MAAMINDERLNGMFAALADSIRRDIVARLAQDEATVNELAAPYAMSLLAVSQHLAVLERCGLISRGRHRQTRPCQLEPEALQAAVSWVEESRRTGAEGWTGSKPTWPTSKKAARERRRADPSAGLPCAARAGVAVPDRTGRTRPVLGSAGCVTTPLEGVVVELRAGGRFETLMVGDHGSYRMVAAFTEVVPPERLVWVEAGSGMHTTGTVVDLGDGSTGVIIVQRHVPDAMRSPEAQACFLTSLDKLDEHFTRLTRGATMTDLQPASITCDGLADLLAAASAETWDAPSLCENWQVRHVITHVTMPARLTPEQFGAEMAATGGDFTLLSKTIAVVTPRCRVTSPWISCVPRRRTTGSPPGGGVAVAISHATIHSLDVTLALDRPAVAPPDAVVAVLDQLTATNGALFGVELTGVRLEATDTDWSPGSGDTVRAVGVELVALLGGRTLPDGRPCRESVRNGSTASDGDGDHRPDSCLGAGLPEVTEKQHHLFKVPVGRHARRPSSGSVTTRPLPSSAKRPPAPPPTRTTAPPSTA